jgi:2-polyprenyl-6-methoxyphenol hydroxylase-like FAD-dependent oxidoreductase
MLRRQMRGALFIGSKCEDNMSELAATNQSMARAAKLGHVIVIGGGIGGLTLAQGLKQAGISVSVYERDRTSADRAQGYRVHINPTGSRALHACLPAHLFDVFGRTCGRPGHAIQFLTERMEVLLSVGGELTDRHDPIGKHRSVSRITLRRVLLSGLDRTVYFGKTFTRYEERDQRLVAHFEDGTTAAADVLVAADGGGSRVRRQFLPHAERVDTGVIGIAGKVFLDAGNRDRIAPELLEGLALVSAKGGYSLFVALQEIDGAAPDALAEDGIGHADDSTASAGGHSDNRRSYLMWALGARRQKFGLNGNAEELPGEPLRAIVLRAMATWDERFKTLVRLADASTINAIAMRTSRPVAPWPTRRITLIGDAIHSMTPYRGIGANIALKDAVRLRDALVAADRGERALIDAIRDYETGMIAYGFKAVRDSLRAMEQATTDNAMGRIVSRAAFRAIEALPPVKRWFAASLGNE